MALISLSEANGQGPLDIPAIVDAIQTRTLESTSTSHMSTSGCCYMVTSTMPRGMTTVTSSTSATATPTVPGGTTTVVSSISNNHHAWRYYCCYVLHSHHNYLLLSCRHYFSSHFNCHRQNPQWM